LAVLRRQISRPRLEESDRVFLAAASRLLSGKSRPSFFVRPDTLLGWHRQLCGSGGRAPGDGRTGPAVSEATRELVLRLARENSRWGYQRIVGELAGVGVSVSATTVAKILRQADVPPRGVHKCRRLLESAPICSRIVRVHRMGARLVLAGRYEPERVVKAQPPGVNDVPTTAFASGASVAPRLGPVIDTR
jgi:hypothetical protein